MKFLKYSFLFVLFWELMYANDVEYSFHLSENAPYEKEAVFLEVNITQVDPSNVMFFKFSPKVSNEYLFHQIDFKENEKYHDLRHQYYYIIYPKKSAEVRIEFDMMKSITDDDKVAYSISGDRDNVKGLRKEDYVVALEPLVLRVKSTPKNVDIVGDFSLSYSLDKDVTKTFDPVNLKISLKGKGFLSTFDFLEKSENYKLFYQAPKFTQFHTKTGTTTSLEWDYAISAQKDFVLPKKVLTGFNPKTEKIYELVFSGFQVDVQKVTETSLLDKEDLPPKSEEIDWSSFFTFLSYVVVFLAGLLMPKELFYKRVKALSREEVLEEKIGRAKTHKELLETLVLENNHRFSKAIHALEGVVYNNEQKSLSEIKKMI